jgi:hypothetical protein
MTDNPKYKLISLNPISTEGKPGALTEINMRKICKDNDLLFDTYKCFYVNDLNSEQSRGNHSNTNACEILICLQGSFEIKLHDGTDYKTFKLEANQGLFIDKNVWISYYNFINCVMLAFVSIYVSDKESCHDFDTFLSLYQK